MVAETSKTMILRHNCGLKPQFETLSKVMAETNAKPSTECEAQRDIVLLQLREVAGPEKGTNPCVAHKLETYPDDRKGKR
ncbi:hypothetical protein VNO77_25920 [Canavalia gladiata]|uniref:Uncharacterized protein n=1 Tax=Canavalia gladiata TaxID=3824 RepID=A0AAN9Q2Z3_CANGL